MQLEPINYQGNSIGCIAHVDGKVLAITPNGISQECADRSSAIWWLQETNAGRDPNAKSRNVEILILIIAVISIGVFYFPLFF